MKTPRRPTPRLTPSKLLARHATRKFAIKTGQDAFVLAAPGEGIEELRRIFPGLPAFVWAYSDALGRETWLSLPD